MLKKIVKKNKVIMNLYHRVDLRYRILLSTISPELSSKFLYKRAFAKKLDLNNPITLNEKLMWLKLNTYYNNPLITKCADKYMVRDYIKECGCNEILNDLIASWDSVDEIDWASLPNKFALKCNHGSGYNIICTDKKEFDIDNAKAKLSKWMKEDYWRHYAEVNYKYIKKKIICEKYIETDSGFLPDDYKVYCFNGKPWCVMVCVGRESGHPKYYFFDRNWSLLPLNKDSRNVSKDFYMDKPEGIDGLFKYAEMLCKPFPFVRADFYLANGKTIFGELTFTPAGALDSNRLPETDIKFGQMLCLSSEK
ncbi:MAG TPA: glycosyl transferase [Bacteroidales bacterium]|nr:glycosyl transferase [Bacteroidales bacterium]